MPPKIKNNLERNALAVARHNRRGAYIAPHRQNYPHAWEWDAAFHGIGMRHYDINLATDEIRYIMAGQWRNGMIANERMEPFASPSAFAETAMWSTPFLHKDAPRTIPTSGITQPPILAESIWKIGHKVPHDQRQDFWREMIDPLRRYHEWMYNDRDINHEGLIGVVHPWENGMDNTPSMMEHARGLDWGGKIPYFLADASQYLRRDTKIVDPTERSTHDEGRLQALALVSLIKCRYDASRLAEQHPLHFQDVGFNSILIRNNAHLVQMAHEIGQELPDELLINMMKTEVNIEKLWNEDDNSYYPRDAVSGEQIKIQTFASILPMYSGILPRERLDILHGQLVDPSKFWAETGIANVPFDYINRRENGYWHENWINTDWLAIEMAKRAGYAATADELRERTLRTISDNGMHEYFNSRTGKGLGVRGFGWTAMLALDLLR